MLEHVIEMLARGNLLELKGKRESYFLSVRYSAADLHCYPVGALLAQRVRQYGAVFGVAALAYECCAVVTERVRVEEHLAI